MLPGRSLWEHTQAGNIQGSALNQGKSWVLACLRVMCLAVRTKSTACCEVLGQMLQRRRRTLLDLLDRSLLALKWDYLGGGLSRMSSGSRQDTLCNNIWQQGLCRLPCARVRACIQNLGPCVGEAEECANRRAMLSEERHTAQFLQAFSGHRAASANRVLPPEGGANTAVNGGTRLKQSPSPHVPLAIDVH